MAGKHGLQQISAQASLLRLFQDLARRRVSLLSSLPGIDRPVQWQHYPPGDAVDAGGRYLWYYHSHPSGRRRRPGTQPEEHGHIHLFAREMHSGREPVPRHLLAIALDARGLPLRFFTVNGWVTGAAPRSARWSLAKLAQLQLRTGYGDVDRFVMLLCRLCRPQILALLRNSEARLKRLKRRGGAPATHRNIEILSAVSVGLDDF